MAILVDFGVAAPHQNYDVTSRASKALDFFKNFSTRVFSPKCTILPSYSKIGAGRVFLVHPIYCNTLPIEAKVFEYEPTNSIQFINKTTHPNISLIRV